MCDSCSCSSNASANTAVATADPSTAAVSNVYAVAGMTCGHCVTAVTGEVTKIDGVTGVNVDVASGRVTIESATEIDESTLRDAIDEAGYALTGKI